MSGSSLDWRCRDGESGVSSEGILFPVDPSANSNRPGFPSGMEAHLQHPAGGGALACEVEALAGDSGLRIRLPEGFRGGRLLVSGFGRKGILRVAQAGLACGDEAEPVDWLEPRPGMQVVVAPPGRSDLDMFLLLVRDDAEIHFEIPAVDPASPWQLRWNPVFEEEEESERRWLSEWIAELSTRAGRAELVWPFLDNLALHGELVDRLVGENRVLSTRKVGLEKELEDRHRRVSELEETLAEARARIEKAESELRRKEREMARRKLNLAENSEKATLEFRWPSRWFGRARRSDSGDFAGPRSRTMFSLDPLPRESFRSDGEVVLSGWILGSAGRHPERLRIRVGGREHLAELGTFRPEVQTLVKRHPLAGKCGFLAVLPRLRAGDRVEVEAGYGDETWEPVWTGKASELSAKSRDGDEQWRHDPALALDPPAWRRASMIRRLGGNHFHQRASILIVPAGNPVPEDVERSLASLASGIWEPASIIVITGEGAISDDLRKRWAKAGGKLAKRLELRPASGKAILSDPNDSGGGILVVRPGVRFAADALGLFLRAEERERAELVYADHAVSTDSGQLESLELRPAFSPEYLRQSPYVNDGFYLARELADRLERHAPVGGDLFFEWLLRGVEEATAVAHVPEVALTVPLGFPLPRQDREEQERLLRLSEPEVNVSPGESETGFILRRPIPEGAKVGIVILTRDGHEVLRTCLDSYEETLPDQATLPWEIVIVDNGSRDPESLAYLEEVSRSHRVVRHVTPFNYAHLNNVGEAALSDDVTHVLFSNNDMEATDPGWLEALVSPFARREVGVTGAKLYYPDGMTLQHSGVVVGFHGAADHLGRFQAGRDLDKVPLSGPMGGYLASREVAAVTGACLLIQRELFHRIGGFDESFVVGFNDTDLCLRCWETGASVIFVGEASLLHHESFTRGKQLGGDVHPEDTARFRRRWAGLLKQGDPYYHPRLVRDSTGAGIDNNRPGRGKGRPRTIPRDQPWLIRK